MVDIQLPIIEIIHISCSLLITILSPLTSYLSPLKYIGTRTLDIYLLHYFFLPRFLLIYAHQLQAVDSRLLEFVVAILLSLIVVAVCLLVSYVIRLNPFLGHYLFGVKRHTINP